MDRTILHCDLNNFYASVECVLNPELMGRPVAVCGDPKKRHGIVLAKSNAAKKCNVKTGDVIWQAQQKCPNLIIVPPHFEEYVKYSEIVFEIYTRYTDRVESFGIDECWLDVSGSLGLFGSGKEIADRLRADIKHETGLTISAGVSFTKVFAKLGSDLKKPDATTVIDRNNYQNIVWPLKMSEMLMVGRQLEKKLNNLRLYTIGDLAHADRDLMRAHLGIIADKLIDSARGDDSEEVKLYYNRHIPKSVGHGTTTGKDIVNFEAAKVVVYALSEMVATRLRRYGLYTQGVSIGVKDCYFHGFSRQMTLSAPTCNAAVIAKNALELLNKNYSFSIPLRHISVYTGKLTDGASGIQCSMFDDDEKQLRLEQSVDRIREKYGYKSVQRAILLKNDLITGNLHEEDDFLPFKKN